MQDYVNIIVICLCMCVCSSVH